jgi:hypothetical protein
LTRTRSLFAAALLALAVPVTIAGCGGDDGADQDPQEVLDATFNNDETVSSGVLDISVDASAGDQGSFDASLEGPFQGDADDPTALPQLDLAATVSGEGAGQSVDFDGGITVTSDNAFVEYGGQAYELGSDMFEQFKKGFESQAGQTAEGEGSSAEAFKESCEQAIEAQGGDASACDFDVSAWFTNLANDGTEDVEGTSTVHISGDIDVAQMLEDLSGLAQSVPTASGQVDQAQIDQAAEAISDASFDVYSGEDDDILRKLDFNLSVDPSAVAGATPVPVDSVDLGFSVALSSVNEEQTIEAPSDAQPIEDLLGQFGVGGLGPLGGAGLGGLGGGSDLGLGGGGGGGGDVGAGGSQAYLDCVEAAGSDPEQAADCLDELQ